MKRKVRIQNRSPLEDESVPDIGARVIEWGLMNLKDANGDPWCPTLEQEDLLIEIFSGIEYRPLGPITLIYS